jgi:hypothetical protein
MRERRAVPEPGPGVCLRVTQGGRRFPRARTNAFSESPPSWSSRGFTYTTLRSAHTPAPNRPSVRLSGTYTQDAPKQMRRSPCTLTTSPEPYVSLPHSRSLDVYEERYAARYGVLRAVGVRALEAFQRCGILAWGFARVRCPDCRHEYLLALMTAWSETSWAGGIRASVPT